MQDLQPPAAWKILAELWAGGLSYPVALFRHVTSKKVSALPHLIPSAVPLKNKVGRNWEEGGTVVALLAELFALKEQLLSISHLETLKPDMFHLPKYHDSHEATSCCRLLTLVSSLPVEYFLLCMRHTKIIRCKERGDIATWLMHLLGWEKDLSFGFQSCLHSFMLQICVQL